MNKRISTRHWLTLMKVISSYLTLMEIRFHLKDVELMRIKMKNPPLDQTSKRRRARKEPESTSVPKEKTSKTTGKSTEGSKSHHKSAGESGQVEEPIHTAKDLKEPANQEFKTGNWNISLKKSTKATTDQLDWNNPEGQQYPHDLRKPLPLIPNYRGRRVIPFDHFINNDLVYLSGGISSRTFTTLMMKTKAIDYGNIKWIKDMVPNTMWSPVPVNYDKHALWGISHWGQQRQQFYGFVANK
ncbi:hypothetical protein Tco_0782442 [Tanacetum coccineum]